MSNTTTRTSENCAWEHEVCACTGFQKIRCDQIISDYLHCTDVIRDTPLHPRVWFNRAQILLPHYPELAIADSYRAFLLSDSELKLSKDSSEASRWQMINGPTPAMRSYFRIRAGICCYISLRILGAHQQAEDNFGRYIPIKWLANDSSLQLWELISINRRPKLTARQYPWFLERRSQRDINQVQNLMRVWGVQLQPAFNGNDPNVLGVFAGRDINLSIGADREVAKLMDCKSKVYEVDAVVDTPSSTPSADGTELSNVDVDDGVDVAFQLLKHHLQDGIKSIKAAKSGELRGILRRPDVSTLTTSIGALGVRFDYHKHVLDIFHILQQEQQTFSIDCDFDQILNLYWRIQVNCYSEPSALPGKKRGGISKLFSFFNHSCEPNARWSFAEEEDEETGVAQSFIRITPLRNIAAGEEIFLSYIARVEHMSLQQRQKMLKDWFVHDCNCARCVREMAERDVRQRQDSRTAVGNVRNPRANLSAARRDSDPHARSKQRLPHGTEHRRPDRDVLRPRNVVKLKFQKQENKNYLKNLQSQAAPPVQPSPVRRFSTQGDSGSQVQSVAVPRRSSEQHAADVQTTLGAPRRKRSNDGGMHEEPPARRRKSH